VKQKFKPWQRRKALNCRNRKRGTMNMMQNYNVNVPVMKGIAECAEMFGISQRYCRELAKTGVVRAGRVGRGKILVNVQSMADYFNQTTIPEDVSPNQGGIQPISVRL
jgi:hypothetical protein